MEWGIIAGYTVVLLIVILPVTQIINSLLGGGIGYLLGGNFPLIGLLVGSMIIWALINLLWVKIFGTHLPILAIFLCISWLFLETYRKQSQLNQAAKWMIAAEQWALVIISIYIFMNSDKITWY